MSREIKFRAWCPTKKTYVDPTYDNVELSAIFQLPFYEMEQFTGLPDKNGVEIFEGDIISNHISNTMLFEIKFTNDFAFSAVLIPADGYGHRKETFLTALGNTLEVVGNIHESPELLEQTK